VSRVVVLVHGFLAPRASMLPLRDALRRDGHPTWTVGLDPLVLGSLESQAAHVAARVRDVLAREGEERCTLVGVSQGGLIGAWYVKLGEGARTVDHLVAVGAPLRGVWGALGLAVVVGGVSRGVWQMLPASRSRRRLEASAWPSDVKLTCVMRERDPVVPVEAARVAGAEVVVVPGGGPLAHQRLIVDPEVRTAIRDAISRRTP
jgi:pimeloyl-ACP methyl ester carboxylesterase